MTQVLYFQKSGKIISEEIKMKIRLFLFSEKIISLWPLKPMFRLLYTITKLKTFLKWEMKCKKRCSFTWGNQYTSDCQHLVSKRIKSSVYYDIDDWAPRPKFDSISGEREGIFLRLIVML